jgi:hypothetical protein
MGPVHSPAAVTIHSENQQKARQHHKQQETTQKPNKPFFFARLLFATF